MHVFSFLLIISYSFFYWLRSNQTSNYQFPTSNSNLINCCSLVHWASTVLSGRKKNTFWVLMEYVIEGIMEIVQVWVLAILSSIFCSHHLDFDNVFSITHNPLLSASASSCYKFTLYYIYYIVNLIYEN
jgi:hypothetical protein